MKQTAAGLPHTRRTYPLSWLRAREALTASGAESLSYAEYEERAVGAGLDAVSARSLAINCHALGHWVHYADEDQLAQLVILKPDWLSVAIAAVFDDRDAGNSGGLVRNRHFGQIWSAPGHHIRASAQVMVQV